MNNLKKLCKAFGIAIGLIFSGCSGDAPEPSESFFQIYDHSDFDLGFDPIATIEVIDGFIILAGTEQADSDFDGILLLKTDQNGDFQVSEEAAFDNLEAPVGDLYFDATDSSIYFFAKNTSTLNAALVKVNTSLELVSTSLVGGSNYPLSAAATSNQTLLLQSYNPLDLTTEFAEFDLNGILLNEQNYSIGPGSDVEQEIIEHFLETGKQPLPFFCGQSGSGYFFNGFYNYNFSLVFNDFGAPTRVVQGLSSDAGVRAALPLSDGSFAVAGYQYDNNYQLSSNPLTIGNIADLYPGNMAELKPYTPVNIIEYTRNGTPYTVFASETKSGQVVLHFYNQGTGEVSGVYYIGYLNPFSLAEVIATSNESLTVLGTTFVAGRFERILLNKISSEEIGNILN